MQSPQHWSAFRIDHSLRNFRPQIPGFRAHRLVKSRVAGTLAHQLLVTALGAGSSDVDAFVLDVIWTAEFARAGWLADLSADVPPERVRSEFLAGPARAATPDGRTRALPWFVDVGLLYYRTDLVPEPPRTYAALEADARAAMARHPGLSGFVWQGRQYEGLSCNFFEAVWGHRGEAHGGGRLDLDSPVSRDALRWLRGLVERGVSPPWVAVAAEEDTRRAFQEGRAAFMRNWPYAWTLLQEPGSPVRGKVAVAGGSVGARVGGSVGAVVGAGVSVLAGGILGVLPIWRAAALLPIRRFGTEYQHKPSFATFRILPLRKAGTER